MYNKHSIFKRIKNAITALILIVLTFLIMYQLNIFNETLKLIELRRQVREIYEGPEFSVNIIPLPVSTPEAEIIDEPETIDQRLLTLREQYNNDDIVGFISIEGTSIDYPVLHSSDNNFYLYRNLSKQYSVAGSIFLDYENNIELEDKNTILYGHNMNADIMFHSLRYYQDKDFYEKHKYIKFNTLYGNYVWEIFSFYRTTTDFYYIQVIFEDDEEFEGLLNEMKERSLYDTGVIVTKEDRILTLSTCTNETDDTRFVINARLINE